MPPLIRRQMAADAALSPVKPRYRIIYVDPDDPDERAVVVAPSPRWLATALAGGVQPPISARMADRAGYAASPTYAPRAPYADPVGAMTEEQATEYLAMWVVPHRVWARAHNRVLIRIVPVEAILADRTYRGAWRLAQEA